jgi:hypothetical protein
MEPKSTDIRVELVAASGLKPLKNLVRQKNRKKSGFHKKKSCASSKLMFLESKESQSKGLFTD